MSLPSSSVIVKVSRKIVDFMDKQKLLDVIEDFIRGEITHDKAKNIYTIIREQLLALKSIAIN